MKQRKVDGGVEIYDLSSNELRNFLKVQIPLTIVLKQDLDGNPIEIIQLQDRIAVNNIQCVKIIDNDGKKMTASYKSLIAKLAENSDVPVIIIDSNVVREKQSLLDIVSDIRKEIIDNCICIDYNKGTFVVKNPNVNGRVQEMYYFEDTKTVYIFSDAQPRLEDTNKNIRELIC